MAPFPEAERIFTCLRHGKTDKHQDDRRRQLNAVGKEQATVRRIALGSPTFDLVIVPDTDRAKATARIIAGDDVPMVIVDALYSEPSKDVELNAMADALGYKPLAVYYKEPFGKPLFRAHGNRAWPNVFLAARSRDAKNILVIGSAMLLPAMGEAALSETNEDATALIEMNPGECCGFKLDVWDCDVSYRVHKTTLID